MGVILIRKKEDNWPSACYFKESKDKILFFHYIYMKASLQIQGHDIGKNKIRWLCSVDVM